MSSSVKKSNAQKRKCATRSITHHKIVKNRIGADDNNNLLNKEKTT